MTELVIRLGVSADDAIQLSTTGDPCGVTDQTTILGTANSCHFAGYRFTTITAAGALSDLTGAVVSNAYISFWPSQQENSTGWSIEWIAEKSATPVPYANTTAGKVWVSGGRTYIGAADGTGTWTHNTSGQGTGLSVAQTAEQFGTWSTGVFKNSLPLTTLIQAWINAGYPATATGIAIAAHAWTTKKAGKRSPCAVDNTSPGFGSTYYPHLHITYTIPDVNRNIVVPAPTRVYTSGWVPAAKGDGVVLAPAPPSFGATAKLPVTRGSVAVPVSAPPTITATGYAPTTRPTARVLLQAPPVLNLSPQLPIVLKEGAATLLVITPIPTKLALSSVAPTTVGHALALIPAPSSTGLTARAPMLANKTAVAVAAPTIISFTALTIGIVQPGSIAVQPGVVNLGLLAPMPTVLGASAADYFRPYGLTRVIDSSKVPIGAKVYFEAVLNASLGGKIAKARLLADGSSVGGVELETIAPTRIRSIPLSLPAGIHSYNVEFGGTAGDWFCCWAADLIIKST